MQTLWVKLASEPEAISIEYTGEWFDRYPTIESFVDNFRTGWGTGDDADVVTHVAVTKDGAQPSDSDWRANP